MESLLWIGECAKCVGEQEILPIFKQLIEGSAYEVSAMSDGK